MKTNQLLSRCVAGFLLFCVATLAEDSSKEKTADAQIVEGSFLIEQIIWVGEQPPAEMESRELLAILQHLDQPDWPAKLEKFVEANPASPWLPALRNALAALYRRTGRYTPALNHWEAVWAVSKHCRDGNGKLVADAALVNWLGLLSSLGRTETIKGLLEETKGRGFARQQDRQKWDAATDAYYMMLQHPAIAYRCGTLALKAVGQTLQPTNRALETLVEASSPTNGFSLSALVEM